MTEVPSVLVVGAGPAGLAVAACLGSEGVPFRLVDRSGMTGGAYKHIYSGITLASPTRYAGLPGLRLRTRGEYVTVPEYHAYLDRYAAHHQLRADRAEVQLIERQGRGFFVHFADADPAAYVAVIVATGMYDFPVRPAIPGLPPDGPEGPGRPAVVHTHDWPGPERFRGRRMLIIGGGISAVEIAEECAAPACRSSSVLAASCGSRRSGFWAATSTTGRTCSWNGSRPGWCARIAAGDRRSPPRTSASARFSARG